MNDLRSSVIITDDDDDDGVNGTDRCDSGDGISRTKSSSSWQLLYTHG